MRNEIETRKGGAMSERDYCDLQEGQRVYYTGDVMNQPAWCTITARNDDPRWGLSYDLMADGSDDDREFRGIRASNFSGMGRRFQIKEEYDAERAEKMAAMRANLAAVAASNREGGA